jgi:phage-related protein
VKEHADIFWVGDAKTVLSGFPEPVKGVLGYSLRRLQKGLLPDCDTRRMESVGKGVWELKTADERSWYRVIYLTRIGDRIYVLHSFEKSSRKTDKRDREIAAARLRLVLAQLRTTKEEGDEED